MKLAKVGRRSTKQNQQSNRKKVVKKDIINCLKKDDRVRCRVEQLDPTTTLRLLKFRISPSGWAHFSAFSSHDLRIDWLKQPILLIIRKGLLVVARQRPYRVRLFFCETPSKSATPLVGWFSILFIETMPSIPFFVFLSQSQYSCSTQHAFQSAVPGRQARRSHAFEQEPLPFFAM